MSEQIGPTTDSYLLKLLGVCAHVVGVPPLQVPHSKRPKCVQAKRLFYHYLRTHSKLGWVELAELTGHTHPAAYTLAGPQGRKRLNPEQVDLVEWWMATTEIPEEWRRGEK